MAISNTKFVKEIMVIDPDTNGEVHLAVYKHENGGMFAVDSSFIDQEMDETDIMSDPFDLDGHDKVILN